jgi:hypothetical protein
MVQGVSVMLHFFYVLVIVVGSRFWLLLASVLGWSNAMARKASFLSNVKSSQEVKILQQ